MIPYAEAINRQDMLNYWGSGFVLLQFGGVWSAYQLYDVSDDGNDMCTLRGAAGLRDEAAPKEVVLSKERFFEQALLHRPPLGPVFDAKGKAVNLSWRAARGDKIKAIVPEDVFLTELPFSLDEGLIEAQREPASLHDAGLVWAAKVNEFRKFEPFGMLPPVEDVYPYPEIASPKREAAIILGRRREARPDTMKLVLAYLNRIGVSLFSAGLEALERGAAVDENDLIVVRDNYDTDYLVHVYIADTLLGTMRRSMGGWRIEYAEHSNPVKARALAGLFETFIPKYGRKEQ